GFTDIVSPVDSDQCRSVARLRACPDYSEGSGFVRTIAAISEDQRIWFLLRKIRRAAASVSGVPLLFTNDRPEAYATRRSAIVVRKASDRWMSPLRSATGPLTGVPSTSVPDAST